MRYLPGGLLALLILWGVARADHLPGQDGTCYQYDCNGDGVVNSLDLLAVALHFGTVVPTWTSTPPPTATASATPTPAGTPTPSPTATPTGGLTAADLLAHTTGPHDGTLCPLPGYDWYDWGRGRVNEAVGGNAIAAWWTVQWAQCGQRDANTVFEIRNLRVYARTVTGWWLYAEQDNPHNWCAQTLHNTATLAGGCVRVGADGYRMPTVDNLGRQLALHGAESTSSAVPGYQCHVVYYEARKIGAGEIMANTGLDWRVGNASAGDSWFGSYVRVAAAWRWIGGTSCSASQLSGVPLP